MDHMFYYLRKVNWWFYIFILNLDTTSSSHQVESEHVEDKTRLETNQVCINYTARPNSLTVHELLPL